MWARSNRRLTWRFLHFWMFCSSMWKFALYKPTCQTRSLWSSTRRRTSTILSGQVSEIFIFYLRCVFRTVRSWVSQNATVYAPSVVETMISSRLENGSQSKSLHIMHIYYSKRSNMLHIQHWSGWGRGVQPLVTNIDGLDRTKNNTVGGWSTICNKPLNKKSKYFSGAVVALRGENSYSRTKFQVILQVICAWSNFLVITFSLLNFGPRSRQKRSFCEPAACPKILWGDPRLSRSHFGHMLWVTFVYYAPKTLRKCVL